MNNIDYIYYKLSQKYGIGNIAFAKEIKTQYNTKANSDNIFEVTDITGVSFGGTYFIKLTDKSRIDLQKEKMEGTFNE